MPRFALPELEDQPWCPRSLRDAMTDFLRGAFHLLGQYRPVAPLLAEALDAASEARLVDLGSGAGGPWPDLLGHLDRHRAPAAPRARVVLTDLYPNHRALDDLVRRTSGRIQRIAEPVDARAVPAGLTGLRTVFTAFHHFSPRDGRKILADAVDAGEPIAIVEVTERSARALLVLALGVLPLSFLMAPFLRPFRWSRLFWTYVVPLGPLGAAWDGLASCLRSYHRHELEGLAASVAREDWRWTTREIRYWRGWSPVPVTALVGVPIRRPDAGAARPGGRSLPPRRGTSSAAR